MPQSDAAGRAAVNTDIKAVHTDLIAIAAALDEAVGKAKTAAEVNDLLDKLADVNDRVTAIGRKLFAQQTAAIHDAASAVTKATAKTRQAIAELDEVKDIIEGVTRFLTLVDKVIAVAGRML